MQLSVVSNSPRDCAVVVVLKIDGINNDAKFVIIASYFVIGNIQYNSLQVAFLLYFKEPQIGS